VRVPRWCCETQLRPRTSRDPQASNAPERPLTAAGIRDDRRPEPGSPEANNAQGQRDRSFALTAGLAEAAAVCTLGAGGPPAALGHSDATAPPSSMNRGSPGPATAMRGTDRNRRLPRPRRRSREESACPRRPPGVPKTPARRRPASQRADGHRPNRHCHHGKVRSKPSILLSPNVRIERPTSKSAKTPTILPPARSTARCCAPPRFRPWS